MSSPLCTTQLWQWTSCNHRSFHHPVLDENWGLDKKCKLKITGVHWQDINWVTRWGPCHSLKAWKNIATKSCSFTITISQILYGTDWWWWITINKTTELNTNNYFFCTLDKDYTLKTIWWKKSKPQFGPKITKTKIDSTNTNVLAAEIYWL